MLLGGGVSSVGFHGAEVWRSHLRRHGRIWLMCCMRLWTSLPLLSVMRFNSGESRAEVRFH